MWMLEMSDELFLAIGFILILVFCVIFFGVRYLIRRHRKVWRPEIKYLFSDNFSQLQKQNKAIRKHHRLVLYQQKVQKY